MGAGARLQGGVRPAHRPWRPPAHLRIDRHSARRAWSLLFAFVMSLAGGASLVLAPEAVAHNTVVSTTPEDGATVMAPDVVEALFDEELSGQAPQVVLIDSAGWQRQVGAPLVDGQRITQSVGTLPSGPYVMSFRVVSADGHPVTSNSSFTVADAPASPAEPTAPSSHPFTHDSSEPPIEGDLFGEGDGYGEGDDLAVVRSDGSGVDGWVLVGFGMAFAAGAMAALSLAAFERRGFRGPPASGENAGKDGLLHRHRQRHRWRIPFRGG